MRAMLILTLFLLGSLATAAEPVPPAATADATEDAVAPVAAEAPDPLVLAQMQSVARDGRFAEAFKRGLRDSPAGALKDRVLALDDEVIADVFARTVARRFDVVEATAIAAFYASPDGQALTATQLADAQAPAPALEPAQKQTIEAFFASAAGSKFNAVMSDKATFEELQLALAFIAGPGE